MRELQNCRGVVDNSCQRKCVTDFRRRPLRKRPRRSRRLISLQGDQIPQKRRGVELSDARLHRR